MSKYLLIDIFFDGKIITHNDSGGEAALYEIDITTERFLKKWLS